MVHHHPGHSILKSTLVAVEIDRSTLLLIGQLTFEFFFYECECQETTIEADRSSDMHK